MIDIDVLLKALHDSGVDYVVVGGVAALIRGGSRATKDLDIVYHTRTSNVERLCKVVNGFKPRIMLLGKPEGEGVVLTPQMLKRHPLLQLMTTAGPVDLLRNIMGFQSYAAIKKRSTQIVVPAGTTRVLTREGLIKSKKALGRPKDREDIKQLEALDEIERASP